jgi:hypothetical protein
MSLRTVMTGLVPVIHVLPRHELDVDRRDEPGDDGLACPATKRNESMNPASSMETVS